MSLLDECHVVYLEPENVLPDLDAYADAEFATRLMDMWDGRDIAFAGSSTAAGNKGDAAVKLKRRKSGDIMSTANKETPSVISYAPATPGQLLTQQPQVTYTFSPSKQSQLGPTAGGNTPRRTMKSGFK